MSYKITDELPKEKYFVCVWKHKGFIFSNSFEQAYPNFFLGYSEHGGEALEDGFYDEFLPWESENLNITDIKFIVEEK